MMAKENKLRLVAYCGLYCPRCYKMKIADAAELLDKELESATKKGASYLENYSSLKEILRELIDLRCIKLCREGGGKSSSCVIKICCDEHKVVGCWECSDFEGCKKLKQQFVENVKRIRKVGVERYVMEFKRSTKTTFSR